MACMHCFIKENPAAEFSFKFRCHSCSPRSFGLRALWLILYQSGVDAAKEQAEIDFAKRRWNHGRTTSQTSTCYFSPHARTALANRETLQTLAKVHSRGP